MLQQNSSRWTLPSDRWVLHSTPLLGNLTSRWIDVQVSAANRFDFRLLGLETVSYTHLTLPTILRV